jgi:hypothetical protein
MTITITCPHGFGETDRSRCVDRVACLLPHLVCVTCPVPVALIAIDGMDADAVAGRLTRLLSSAWTPPVVPRKCTRPFNGSMPRGKALALALRRTLGLGKAKQPAPAKVGLAKLLRDYRRLDRAPHLADVEHLRRALRQCGLPMTAAGNSFVVEACDHVRAFVRSYYKEAA